MRHAKECRAVSGRVRNAFQLLVCAQVSWLVKANGGGSVNAQYYTTDGDGEGWVNDSNGIPETLALGVDHAWTQMQDSVSSTRTLSSSMTTMQKVSVPSAGTYVVVRGVVWLVCSSAAALCCVLLA